MVTVQPCMEWIPIKNKNKKNSKDSFNSANIQLHQVIVYVDYNNCSEIFPVFLLSSSNKYFTKIT